MLRSSMTAGSRLPYAKEAGPSLVVAYICILYHHMRKYFYTLPSTLRSLTTIGIILNSNDNRSLAGLVRHHSFIPSFVQHEPHQPSRRAFSKMHAKSRIYSMELSQLIGISMSIDLAQPPEQARLSPKKPALPILWGCHYGSTSLYKRTSITRPSTWTTKICFYIERDRVDQR